MAGRATERTAWFCIQSLTSLKMRGGNALFEEGHAAGLTHLIAEIAAKRRAAVARRMSRTASSPRREDSRIHDVGDTGDGQGNEGTVDDGDEEEAEEAEAEEEMQEGAGVLPVNGRGLGHCGGDGFRPS